MSANFDLNPGKHQASKKGKKVKAASRKHRNVKFFRDVTHTASLEIVNEAEPYIAQQVANL